MRRTEHAKCQTTRRTNIVPQIYNLCSCQNDYGVFSLKILLFHQNNEISTQKPYVISDPTTPGDNNNQTIEDNSPNLQASDKET